MSRLVIDLDETQERVLHERARAEHRSPQDLCREAIALYLDTTPSERSRISAAVDPYDALRRLVGLAAEGPTDASVCHDHRPEDEGP